MNIKQYKKEFAYLYNRLCTEHGSCQYVHIDKEGRGIGFTEREGSVNVEIVL